MCADILITLPHIVNNFYHRIRHFSLAMLERLSIINIMNQVDRDKRIRITLSLVEGNSIASTCRMVGVNKRTVLKLLVDLGNLCRDYHDLYVQDLNCKRLQVDEIWSFCYAKQRNVPESLQGQYGYGDIWVWTAIDADTKLCVSWLVGLRDLLYATEFMKDVASRLTNRVQLTSDGLNVYPGAVEEAFGGHIDFAQLIKSYATQQEETRYSPAECIGVSTNVIEGNPKKRDISTSYSERFNLTTRMSIRRFTRLTNAFSKKVENHEAATSLHFWWYNFARRHMTIKTSPAVKAGVTDKIWTAEDLIILLEEEERLQRRARPKKD